MNYKEYGEKMVRDGRFMTVSENGKIILLMLYSVCDDPKIFLDNIDHHYMEHNPNGKYIVIENLVGGKFSMRVLKNMVRVFVEKFPNVEEFKWRRARFPVDKIVTYKRRIEHAIQH